MKLSVPANLADQTLADVIAQRVEENRNILVEENNGGFPAQVCKYQVEGQMHRDSDAYFVFDAQGRTIVFARDVLPEEYFYKDKIDVPFASIGVDLFLGKLGHDAGWISIEEFYNSGIAIETHADVPQVNMHLVALMVSLETIDALAEYKNALVLDLHQMEIGGKGVKTDTMTTKLYRFIEWYKLAYKQ